MLRLRCRFTGLHVTRTRRLLVISSRSDELLRHYELAMDHEGRRWLGFPVEQVRPRTDQPLVADRVSWDDPAILPPLPGYFGFTAVWPGSMQIVGGGSIHKHGNVFRFGGMMREDYRGLGYGTEFLNEITRLAHRHFGVGRLTAGHEDVNPVSKRWLEKSGFTRCDDGPDTFRLSDGRVANAVWLEHVDRRPRLACPWLTGKGQARVAAMIAQLGADDPFAAHKRALWQRDQDIPDRTCPVCEQPLAD